MPKTTTSSYLRNKKVVEDSMAEATGMSKPASTPTPARKPISRFGEGGLIQKPASPAVPKRTLKDKIKNVASALTEKHPAPMPKNPTKSRHKINPDGSSKIKTPRISRRTVDDY